ncbi:MAG: hypothetical protein KF778_22545 [Rhodocyclaceae bacterium]|nr:hypothetical protein [Rhodocyclaceae bacterium]
MHNCSQPIPGHQPLLQQTRHHFGDTVQARYLCRAAGEVVIDFFVTG